MKPILTIRIYKDIDKPHEIMTTRGFKDQVADELYSYTINQLDLFNAIRNAIDERLEKQHNKLKEQHNATIRNE